VRENRLTEIAMTLPGDVQADRHTDGTIVTTGRPIMDEQRAACHTEIGIHDD
jgi:hypothetical protein